MTVLTSSKKLANRLNELDLDFFPVERIVVCDSNLSICSNNMSVDVFSVILTKFDGEELEINQINRRWDGIKKLVNQIDEQPMILKIFEGSVEVILNF